MKYSVVAAAVVCLTISVVVTENTLAGCHGLGGKL